MIKTKQYQAVVQFENFDEVFPILDRILKSINPSLRLKTERLPDKFILSIEFDSYDEYNKFITEKGKQGIRVRTLVPV